MRTSACPLAAAASVAIMPATPSALARAWPCPQPSATTSTTTPPLHFSQSSLLPRWPSAPAAQARTRLVSSTIIGRSWNGAPSVPPSGSASRRPNGTIVASGATRPDSAAVSTARPNSMSRLPQSSRGVAQPPSHPNAESHRLDSPGPRAMRKALIGAEHAIEEARGIRLHQLAAQAVHGRRPGHAASRSARRRASARRPPGRERNAAAMIGLITDAGIASWKTAGLSSASGTKARRIRKALVATASRGRAVVFLPRARRQRAGERLDAPGRHIDDGDRGHAHDRLLEHAVADRASGVLAARDTERAAHVLAAGVARGRLLRERLHRRLDRDVDGEADVDRRSADLDAVRSVAIAGRRFLRRRRRRCRGDRARPTAGAASRAIAASRRATAEPSSARRSAGRSGVAWPAMPTGGAPGVSPAATNISGRVHRRSSPRAPP